MQKPLFQGSALGIDPQIDLLESQGLVIGDRQKARQILRNVSYSRLKAYMVPLMTERTPRKFREGASFNDVYTLYGFDRRLRELVFHEMEKVEISIRTHIAYATSLADAGYWYTKGEHFRSPKEHRNLLERIKGEVKRSDNDAIKRFYEKYSNELPPCWLALEATSMGTLSLIYEDLRPGAAKRQIADYYGLSDTVLMSWLHHLVYVRNICAHHNRLWNKNLSISARIPESPRKMFPPQTMTGPQRVYTTLCVLKYLQDTVKPANTFALRLRTLIDNYPSVDISQMGFPEYWKEFKFWSPDGGKI